MGLVLTSRVHHDWTVISARGSITADTAADLRELLNTSLDTAPRVVLELSDASLDDDAAALAVLMGARKRALLNSAVFLIATPDPTTRSLLDHHGLTAHLVLCSSWEEIASWWSPASRPRTSRKR